MAHLSQVTIKGFKSIYDQTVDLGRLNVFIGTNGAGKSNFLEALGMLSAAVSGRIDYARLAERGVRLSTPEVFKSAFKNKSRSSKFALGCKLGGLEYDVNVTAKKDDDSYSFHAESVKRDGKIIAGRSNHGLRIKGVSIDKSELLRDDSIVAYAESRQVLETDELQRIVALKNFAIYAPSTPILRGLSQDSSNKSPLGLYGGSLSSALKDVFRQRDNHSLFGVMNQFFANMEWVKTFGYSIPVPSLQSSHVHTGTFVVAFSDKFMRTNFKNLYAYDVSEGALYVLFLLVLLIHSKAPDMVALDNVDSALNPGLVRNLMVSVAEILEKMPDKQLFMTTHNPSALDGIDLFNPDHRLFVVRRSREGFTVLDRIQPPAGMSREAWVEQHGAMKLSELWLAGAFPGAMAPPTGF